MPFNIILLCSKFWSPFESYCSIAALLSLLACRASSNDKNECGKETQKQHFTTAVFHTALSLPGQQCYLNGQVWGWAFFACTYSSWLPTACGLFLSASKLIWIYPNFWNGHYIMQNMSQTRIAFLEPFPLLDWSVQTKLSMTGGIISKNG